MMEILKRLGKVLFVIIGMLPFMVGFVIEVIVWSVRWIITGKEFPDNPVTVEFVCKILDL